MQHKPWFKWVLLLAKGAVTGFALWWVLHRIDLIELQTTVAQLHPSYMALAILAMNLSFLFSAFRIRYYIQQEGAMIGRTSAIAITYIGMFLSVFLPGGIGGDGYKVWLASKRLNIPWKRGVQLVLSDRASGLFVLCLLLGIFALVPFPGNIIPWWGSVMWIAFTTICYLIGLRYVVHEKLIVARGAFFYSLLVQLSTLGIAYGLFYAIPDFSAVGSSLLIWFMLFFISNIVACIPISIGGIGLRELTFLYGCIWWELDVQAGVTFALLCYVVTVLTALGGMYFLFAPGYRFSKNLSKQV